MRQWLAPVLLTAGLACAAAAALGAVGRLLGEDGLTPLPVSVGDQEVVWFGANTADTDWQRFVYAVGRAAELSRKAGGGPGWTATETRIGQSRANDIPEVTLEPLAGGGRLRFRWYKLTNSAGFDDWIAALAARRPAPLAIVSNGSSDRARTLAHSLAAREEWVGERPLLLLTSATATSQRPLDEMVEDRPSESLLSVYNQRTFRFCFNNEQMASALLAFLARTPRLEVAGDPPALLAVRWRDEPYSTDLFLNFRDAAKRPGSRQFRLVTPPALPFSVGGYGRPNRHEAELARALLAEIPRESGKRSVLLLPGDSQPSRRMLRALVTASPDVGRHLVVVVGDSLGMSALYRDGPWVWNAQTLPVPVVAFAHYHPADWQEGASDRPDAPPNGTDGLLCEAELVARLAAAARRPDGSLDPAGLADRLRASPLAGGTFFDKNGDRTAGGEYVLWLKPDVTPAGDLRVEPLAKLAIHERAPGQTDWREIKTLDVDYGSPAASE